MQHSILLTTLFSIIQPFFDTNPNPETYSYHSSPSNSTLLHVTPLGVHPTIATEFGARASVLRNFHPHLTSSGRDITILVQDRRTDRIACSTDVVGLINRASILIEGPRGFDAARKAFCYAFEGREIPIRKSLSARVDRLFDENGRGVHFVGSIDNNGGSTMSEHTPFMVYSDDCLKYTSAFVKRGSGKCQSNGAAKGGIYWQNTMGVSFTVYLVYD